MQLGMIGLGRMGGNIVRRLTRDGHKCVVFDRKPAAIKALVGERVAAAADLKQLVGQLEKPRAVWIMLPAGDITEETITQLSVLLAPGDTIIDGGNAFYKDDIRRAKALKAKGIRYVDCGTSGGVWGFERGYCLMIGGEKEAVERLDPIFSTLAPGAGNIEATPDRKGRDPRVERGYMYCGPSGAGRFVKMIHNGIEYGLMQAYAEGFELLEAAKVIEDVPSVIKAWQRGTVVRSWLLDLLVRALDSDPELDDLRGYVEDSGEGRWTVEEAINLAVPAPVISAALFSRFRSRQEDSPAMRAVASLRNQFGGHAVHQAGPTSGAGSTQG